MKSRRPSGKTEDENVEAAPNSLSTTPLEALPKYDGESENNELVLAEGC
jgi:hypothetical protein